MAASQPPLQYAMEKDVDLESKLCEKGLKGALRLTYKVYLAVLTRSSP